MITSQFSIRFPKNEVMYWAKRYCDIQGDDADELKAGERASSAGFYTKRDFLLVCKWKTRGRPRRHYESNSEEDVRRQTAIAFTTLDEKTRIWSLDELPGVGLRTNRPPASCYRPLLFCNR